MSRRRRARRPSLHRSSRKRSVAFEKEFTWRGLPFVWNGRQRLWLSEQPEGQADYWVTQRWYWHSHIRKDVPEDWSSPPPLEEGGSIHGFTSGYFIAHLGFGDAPMRPGRTEALEAALNAAIGFHHGRLGELRTLLHTPQVSAP